MPCASDAAVQRYADFKKQAPSLAWTSSGGRIRWGVDGCAVDKSVTETFELCHCKATQKSIKCPDGKK